MDRSQCTNFQCLISQINQIKLSLTHTFDLSFHAPIATQERLLFTFMLRTDGINFRINYNWWDWSQLRSSREWLQSHLKRIARVFYVFFYLSHCIVLFTLCIAVLFWLFDRLFISVVHLDFSFYFICCNQGIIEKELSMAFPWINKGLIIIIWSFDKTHILSKYNDVTPFLARSLLKGRAFI